MGFGRWYRLLLVTEVAPAATDLDLINDLQAILNSSLRRGVRIPPWYLQQVTVLGILSGRLSLQDWGVLLAVTTAVGRRESKPFRATHLCHRLSITAIFPWPNVRHVPGTFPAQRRCHGLEIGVPSSCRVGTA